MKPVRLVCVHSTFQSTRNRIFSATIRLIMAKKYNNLQGQLRTQKINELLAGLKKNSSLFLVVVRDKRYLLYLIGDASASKLLL